MSHLGGGQGQVSSPEVLHQVRCSTHSTKHDSSTSQTSHNTTLQFQLHNKFRVASVRTLCTMMTMTVPAQLAGAAQLSSSHAGTALKPSRHSTQAKQEGHTTLSACFLHRRLQVWHPRLQVYMVYRCSNKTTRLPTCQAVCMRRRSCSRRFRPRQQTRRCRSWHRWRPHSSQSTQLHKRCRQQRREQSAP